MPFCEGRAFYHRKLPRSRLGRNPEGRSGNHMPQGMLIAAGMGIKSGNINDGHTLDLAPTILAMLDQPIPSDMEGKVLPLFKDKKG